MSTDLKLGDFPPFEEPASAPVLETPGADSQTDATQPSAHAIDIESLLGELDSPAVPPRANVKTETVEVDLSIVLDDFKISEPPPAPPPVRGGDIDGVFDQLRTEASRRSAIDAAEQEYKRGLALRESGDVDGAIAALQAASRAPKLRFATASMVGRIYRERGMMLQSLEWLERAAQAPAPTPADYHALLYELADALESSGETARALAICLELQADAGSYRDVDARVDRLARVQARE